MFQVTTRISILSLNILEKLFYSIVWLAYCNIWLISCKNSSIISSGQLIATYGSKASHVALFSSPILHYFQICKLSNRSYLSLNRSTLNLEQVAQSKATLLCLSNTVVRMRTHQKHYDHDYEIKWGTSQLWSHGARAMRGCNGNDEFVERIFF